MAKKQISTEDLALMVQKGFNDLDTRLGRKIDKLGQDVGSLQQDVGFLHQDIDSLKQGQERIELKLDNTAHRFELVELRGRVEILEKRAGIKK
jgi:polyhydroxyalkanoate synthesis regulator phasin